MKKIFLGLFLLLFVCLKPFAQTYTVSGRVIDSESRVALPFVNIVIQKTGRGGTTDIDGKFSLSSTSGIDTLILSYVGYETQKYPVGKKSRDIVILMKNTGYELPEIVVYPAENPAHRIIQNAIDHKDSNDPEKLPAFSYTAYDKMIFTLELDSLPEPMTDTLEMDTTESFRDFLKNHHLFMMESVAERNFKYPDKNEEKVIATKVSGFKDPIFVFLISQWQSTSFYSDLIKIGGNSYVNPISRGSTRKYFFLLQDTLFYGEHDTVFVISYRPRLKTNFDGLTGVISINTRNWAIQNVIAEPAKKKGMFTFRIEQLYELIDSVHWFPVQINNQAIIRHAMVNDSSIQIGFGSGGDTTGIKTVEIPFGIGKRYIRNINLNPDLRNRDFGNAEVEVDPNATYRSEAFWNNFRVDSLTEKERNTYHYIDSLGRAENFDRMAKSFESLMTGKIPWGYVDLDINRFLRYNSFEGFAPGVGLHTNDRLLQTLHAGGYVRYGLKDKAFKYGGDLDWLIWNKADLKFRFAYMKDVMETGGVRFWDERPELFNSDYFRDLLVRRMDRVEDVNTGLDFRAFRYANFHAGLRKTHKEVTNDYHYGIGNESVNVLFDRFDFTEMTIGLRYAYDEKFVKNLRKKISLGTTYPVLWFQYARGLEGVLNGDFNYNRYDLKIEKSFKTKYIGTASFRFNAGYIDADIPYTNLYNGHGSYRNFTIYAPWSFATMRMNEFLSNKYVAFYFVHDFEKLLGPIGILKPEFAIATNVGFGRLDFTDHHYNISYKTMEKGYYESGLLINNLINFQIYSLGIGAFYRYGPYSFSNGWENLAGKLALKFRFE